MPVKLIDRFRGGPCSIQGATLVMHGDATGHPISGRGSGHTRLLKGQPVVVVEAGPSGRLVKHADEVETGADAFLSGRKEATKRRPASP